MERTFWEWVFLIIKQYWPKFLSGAGTTLLIALTGTIIGFGIGLIIGVIKTIPIHKNENIIKKSFKRIINFILSAYIEIFRGTPMIVQAMVIYYGLMEGFGVDLSPLSAAILIVSINTGAYMSEIVRGGIDSIDKGQFEAAHSIGMTHWQTMINVIIPQTIRNILPATSNEFVINIKDTSVLNVIAVSELYYVSKDIKGALFRTFEVFFVTCVIYFIMTFTITRILRFIERKIDGPSSYVLHHSSTMPNTDYVINKEADHE